jgi:DNA-binding response OmpR family regulator
MRVLIVDGDSDQSALVGEVLSDAGVDVLSAADGATGLELAQTHQPDLILLDIMLPTCDGVDLVYELRNMNCSKHIPTVVMSTEHVLQVHGIALPIDGILPKPFGADALLVLVAAFEAIAELQSLH